MGGRGHQLATVSLTRLKGSISHLGFSLGILYSTAILVMGYSPKSLLLFTDPTGKPQAEDTRHLGLFPTPVQPPCLLTPVRTLTLGLLVSEQSVIHRPAHSQGFICSLLFFVCFVFLKQTTFLFCTGLNKTFLVVCTEPSEAVFTETCFRGASQLLPKPLST